MGYRSEVTLAIRADAAVHEPVASAIATLFGDPLITAPEGRLYYSAWQKWYAFDPEDYPEVHAIAGFVDDDGFAFAYLERLGEDDGDQENAGGWDDHPFDLGYARFQTLNGRPLGDRQDASQAVTRIGEALNALVQTAPLTLPTLATQLYAATSGLANELLLTAALMGPTGQLQLANWLEQAEPEALARIATNLYDAPRKRLIRALGGTP